MQWFSLSLSKKGFCKVWLCTVKITANLPHACTLQIMEVFFSKKLFTVLFPRQNQNHQRQHTGLAILQHWLNSTRLDHHGLHVVL